ncbi:MAG: MFS transporter, partial [Verrucomicrobiota bacterium]
MNNPRSFWFLNVTQFMGALNDNFFKLLLVFALIALQGEDESDRISALAGAVFALPFLLFSAAGGSLADRLSKRTVIVAMKSLELAIMLTGLLAFSMNNEHFLYAVLFVMGVQSALFAPSKYGIVPEIVGRAGLSKGNGFLVAFTYLAIILGFVLAPYVSGLTKENYVMAGVVAVAISGIGLFSSFFIMKTPAASSQTKASV